MKIPRKWARKRLRRAMRESGQTIARQRKLEAEREARLKRRREQGYQPTR